MSVILIKFLGNIENIANIAKLINIANDDFEIFCDVL